MSEPTAMEEAALLRRAERFAAELRQRALASEQQIAAIDRVLIQSRGERLDAADDPLLVVMLCGPTAVGKSSLINALAGGEISRRGIGAETSAPVLYIHEQDDPARLFEYSQALGQRGRETASIVRHRRDELLHKILIDTPDIDSVMRRHGELTEALVHCADVILFVTSPERYKTMQAAEWIAQQRTQRAVAFVLNKWDRATLGIEYDKRSGVYGDLLQVLVATGFANPLVFRVSALPPGRGDTAESELAALAAWLEKGLSRSAAAAIAVRRRRAAWGRLGAAIAPAVPQPLSGHPVAVRAAEQFAADEARAKQIVTAESLALSRGELERPMWPATPGLLGSWTRFWHRLGAGAASARRFLTLGGIGGLVRSTLGGQEQASATDAFGRPAAALLTHTTARIVRDAESCGLPLGPVAAAWAAAPEHLGERLASVAVEIEGALIAAQAKLSLRRAAGIASLYAVEAALAGVLVLAAWRLGSGFVSGDYAPGAILANALALMVALLLIGQTIGNLFFPPLQGRWRRTVAQRAGRIVEQAWESARAEFAAQVAAADRLAEEGKLLMEGIDGIVRRLTPSIAPDDGVSRLFAIPAPPEPITKAAAETRATSQVRRVAFE